MVAKLILVCIQTLALQSIAGQSFISRLGAAPCNTEPWNSNAYRSDAPYASNSDCLPISSASILPPSGVSIISENAYEGSLLAAGALPFLGTVALEGSLPTAGSGAVAFRCGNGEVAMLTEDMDGARIGNPFSFSANTPGLGMNPVDSLSSFAPAAPFAGPAPFPASLPGQNPILAPSPFAGSAYSSNTPWTPSAWASPFANKAYGPAAAAASNGGALPVTSASSVPPSGVNLVSDNIYEGALSIAGAMPFLSTVALEGRLPTAGAGSISFGCGNGDVAMLKEEFAGTGAAFAGPFSQMGCKYGAI